LTTLEVYPTPTKKAPFLIPGSRFSFLFIGHRNVGYWLELRTRSRGGSVLFSGEGSPAVSHHGE